MLCLKTLKNETCLIKKKQNLKFFDKNHKKK